LGVIILLNYQLKNEVSQANFNTYKIIYNWQPFMKRVLVADVFEDKDDAHGAWSLMFDV